MTKSTVRGQRRSPTTSPASPAIDAAALRSRDSTKEAPFRSAFARLLETSQLPRIVPHLPPEALHQLIRQGGLQASGELLSAATPAQVTSVLDLDLWRQIHTGRPGQLDAQFDADRFGEWLDLLADTGEPAASRIVAALDHTLVIAGLSEYVRVFDPPALVPEPNPELIDEEPAGIDATRSDVYECAVGGYLVRATRPDAWDAIVSLLHGLEAGHPDAFHAVMRGCRRLSDSVPEVDGLDNLPMEPQQLMYDLARDRDDRRSQRGYSTTADARAFLQLARQPRDERGDGTPSPNPITAAYFRSFDGATRSTADPVSGPAPRALETSSAASETFDAMADLLAEAGVVMPQPRLLLEGGDPREPRLAHIRLLMSYVRDHDDAAYFARSGELAFLANTLVAGCSIQSRPFTPQEALDAAVGICNLGLEQWPARWPAAGTHDATTLPEAYLASHDLVTAFEVGWTALYREVSMFVAGDLVRTLAHLRSGDAATDKELRALSRTIGKQRDAGTPWVARDALDAIAILDTPASVSLLGLMNECPVLPASAAAALDGRLGSVSATEFKFISTATQIATIQRFMMTLPDLLRP